MKKISVKTCIFCLVMLASSGINAQIPRYLSYEGYLTDLDYNPANSKISVTFRLYANPEPVQNETVLWQENFTDVDVKDGIFSVILGKTTPLPDSSVFKAPLYLGITINSDEELKPRQEIVSVPYSLASDFSFEADQCINAEKISGKSIDQLTAIDLECSGCVGIEDVSFFYAGSKTKGGKADDSDLLDGIDSVDFAMKNHNHEGKDITNAVSEALLADDLQCSGCVSFSEISPMSCKTGSVIKMNDSSGWICSDDIAGTVIDAGSEINYIPKITSSSTIGSSVIYENNGNIGIGMTTPGSMLDVLGTASIGSYVNSGEDIYGLWVPVAFEDIDTCDNDVAAEYICPENLETECIDLRTVSEVSSKRTVSCKVQRGGININADGNTGIGQINPSAKLDVLSSESIMAIFRGSPDLLGYSLMQIINTGSSVQNWALAVKDNGSFAIHQTGQEDRITVMNGGNVGIGTSAPSAKLDVNGSIQAPNICLNGDCRSSWNMGVAYIEATSGGFNIPQDGNYLILAKADRSCGDGNYLASLFIDGNVVDQAFIGDYVSEGGSGGAPDQAQFIAVRGLTAGGHTFSMSEVSDRARFVVLSY
jgi:hypothetical protein